MPPAAQRYVEYIEKHAGAPVKLIGVGGDRTQTINRGL
ncbi:MAG: adenylosuccinate synthetase [Synergistaceae bacterium]|nr:adenylosuccinate synthetase [Synergistaceae bacterium]